MPIKSSIEDAATSELAKVTQGSLQVINHQSPPHDQGPTDMIPFRQLLTDDGTPTGSSDMAVDGSVTPVEFSVTANLTEGRDRYIRSLSILISDGSMDLSIFGGIGVLANGLDVEFFDPAHGAVIINSGITRNVDLVRSALGNPSFGDDANAFKAGLVSAPPTKDDAYLPVIDIVALYGLPRGIRFQAGSEGKILIRVNDDLTGLTEFNAIATGFEHILD